MTKSTKEGEAAQATAAKAGQPMAEGARARRIKNLPRAPFGGIGDLMDAPPLPRRRVALAMSAQEREVVGWMELGCGVWVASQLAEVPLCTVLRWAEDGARCPGGIHGTFAKETGALEAANGHGHAASASEVSFSKASRGWGQRPVNGKGSSANGNGAQHLLTWKDL